MPKYSFKINLFFHIGGARAYELIFFPWTQGMFPFSNLNPVPFNPKSLKPLWIRAKTQPQTLTQPQGNAPVKRGQGIRVKPKENKNRGDNF